MGRKAVKHLEVRGHRVGGVWGRDRRLGGDEGLGDDGRTRGDVVDKDGAGVVEGVWEGRLWEEIGRERVDVPMV